MQLCSALYEKKEKYLYWLMCVISAMTLLCFLGDKGPVMEVDSPTFLRAEEGLRRAYPLYTAFLLTCRSLFGEKYFLDCIFALQSILAFVSSFCMAEFLRRWFRLRFLSAFFIYLCIYLPYAYSLPESMANHHILTEALAFPLFTLYMLFVFKTFLEKKIYWMVFVAVFTILLFLTRSQLMLLFPVYIVLWAVIGLQRIYERIKEKNKVFFWTSLVAMVVALGVAGIVAIVSLIGNNTTGQFSQLTVAVSGRVLCMIDEEDRELFSGLEQEAFDAVYRKIDEQQSRYPYFREGIWRWADIVLGTDMNTWVYESTLTEYYGSVDGDYTWEMISASDKNIISKLFVHHLDDYLVMTIHLLAQSFVAAIFIHPPAIIGLCYVVTGMIYLLAFVLLWYAQKKKVPTCYRLPLWLTILLIVSIVVITNLVFCGIQRYVVYAFGCFYLSVFILLVGIYRTICLAYYKGN